MPESERTTALQPTASLRLRLTIVVALVALAALVAAGVARLDDRGEVSTGLVTTAPATPVAVGLAADLDPVIARSADRPDKAAARAVEWAAAAAAAEEAEAAAAPARAATTTSPPATAAPARPAAPAPQAAPPPARPAPQPSPPPAAGGSLYDKLDNIARCESGMNPKAYNGAGPYLGAFQFHPSTWAGLGESGDPRDYSYSYQRDVAARLALASGFGASWPSCSAKYGYG